MKYKPFEASLWSIELGPDLDAGFDAVTPLAQWG
jgi:hypothetical protein